MRAIDADKLKRKAQKVGTEAWKMNLTAKVETTLNQFIDWIDEQPTIQPEILACGNGELIAKLEPQWIPVSERLPEKGGEYLVSVHHTIGAISVLHPEKDTYVDDVAIMKYYGKFPSTVRAWMPLPKPFEGGTK